MKIISKIFVKPLGTTLHENHWLRSWSNNTYLWYNEITDRDPAPFTTADYFDLLKTNATTASGSPKDNFHFTSPTEVWLQRTQAGISAGFGAKWAIIASAPPRELRVAFTEPDTTAAANLTRGTEILEINGVDVVNAGTQAEIDIINAALFPATEGESHTFTVRDVGSSVTRSFSMTSAAITTIPVQNVSIINTNSGNVGYILFNTQVWSMRSINFLPQELMIWCWICATTGADCFLLPVGLLT